ncbi:unnamed protein product [Cylindrotheca closterium]|uniref:PNPLA domain-containing protein n=1 Tax=Cylindrotheca closterium TaxID=2856 RepID=A0AAD2CGU3_9STRA|nr:unnamed protein product [Cylindrotheca closterium]
MAKSSKRSTKRPIESSTTTEPSPKKTRIPEKDDEIKRAENQSSSIQTNDEATNLVSAQSQIVKVAPSIYDNTEEQCDTDDSNEISELPPQIPQQKQVDDSTTIMQTDGTIHHPPTITRVMQPPPGLEMEFPTQSTADTRYRYFWAALFLALPFISIIGPSAFGSTKQIPNTTDHLIPPNHGLPVFRSSKTLRSFLLEQEGFHLGMAPAFFGYYGYFGALAAWDDELSNSSFPLLKQNIKSVAGASAGAMAAILLASGIPPKVAADFCSTISLGDFADPPGLLTVFRGDKFEEIMHNFMAAQNPNSSLQLQDSIIPVSVSGYDLLTLEGKLLTRGSMARAARASACFPVLFQPVGWVDKHETFLFVDGGLADYAGLNGLGAFGEETNGKKKRVVNIVVGDFQFGNVLGPSSMPKGVDASEVVSISIQGLPQCGPWAMERGPQAVTAARLAMVDALDLPMFQGKEEGHYELHIDASSYVPVVDR